MIHGTIGLSLQCSGSICLSVCLFVCLHVFSHTELGSSFRSGWIHVVRSEGLNPGDLKAHADLSTSEQRIV